MSTEKIEEVYRCPECDECFPTLPAAALHCVDLPKEYKCLGCGYVWMKLDHAIHCFDVDKKRAEYEANNPWYELPPDTVNGI